MLVRFISDKRKEIVTWFIGWIPVQETTGEKIFNLIDERIKRCGQSLSNCVSFATDGASNMVGCNISVWSRLKAISPFCVHLKCMSFAGPVLSLCSIKTTIKYWIFTVRIPNWFHHSEVTLILLTWKIGGAPNNASKWQMGFNSAFKGWRQEAYKELFRVMDTATEFEPNRTAPLPSENPSLCGDLCAEKLMFNILMNWEELKAYFTSAELAPSQFDTKFKARLLMKRCQTRKSTCSLSFQHLLCRNLKDWTAFCSKPKVILMNCTNKYSYIWRVFRTDCQSTNGARILHCHNASDVFE